MLLLLFAMLAGLLMMEARIDDSLNAETGQPRASDAGDE